MTTPEATKRPLYAKMRSLEPFKDLGGRFLIRQNKGKIDVIDSPMTEEVSHALRSAQGIFIGNESSNKKKPPKLLPMRGRRCKKHPISNRKTKLLPAGDKIKPISSTVLTPESDCPLGNVNQVVSSSKPQLKNHVGSELMTKATSLSRTVALKNRIEPPQSRYSYNSYSPSRNTCNYFMSHLVSPASSKRSNNSRSRRPTFIMEREQEYQQNCNYFVQNEHYYWRKDDDSALEILDREIKSQF